MQPGMVYDSTVSTTSTYYNPWTSNVAITGTDGKQFAGQLSSDMSVDVFMP